jgi:glutathione gamma-glutamylcysteinyltransferase
VKGQGITLDQFVCLARYNGAIAHAHRAGPGGLQAFRAALRAAAVAPGRPVMAIAYSRRVLGQTGDGHFSPVAGYHAGRDLALVLDVARFKYPPHWVPVPLLWEAMLPADPATACARGYVLLERGAAAGPIFFQLATTRYPWREVATQLFRELPAALADEKPDSVDSVARAFFRHPSPAVATTLGSGASEGNARLSPEHQRLVEALFEGNRQSALFAPVQAALADSAREPGSAAAAWVGSHEHPAEAAAVLLLMAPDALFAGLPAGTRAVLAEVRSLDALPAPLGAEVERLREQVAALTEYHCGEPDGRCR